MIVARSEQDIINNAEGKGSMDCALKAFRQGKKVLICNPKDTTQDILKELNEQSGSLTAKGEQEIMVDNQLTTKDLTTSQEPETNGDD